MNNFISFVLQFVVGAFGLMTRLCGGLSPSLSDLLFVLFCFNKLISPGGANCVVTDILGGVWCC